MSVFRRSSAMLVLVLVLVLVVLAACLTGAGPAFAAGLGPSFNGGSTQAVPVFYAFDPSRLIIGMGIFQNQGTSPPPDLSLFSRWRCDPGGFDLARMQSVAQTMELPGRPAGGVPIALYSYGGSRSVIIAWRRTPWTTHHPYLWTPLQLWRSSSFDERKAKLTMTKIVPDGASFPATDTYEPVALYDYGTDGSALWYFRPSEPGTLTASRGPRLDADWDRCTVIGGDFDADKAGDVALVYDYGDARTGIWIVDGRSRKPRLAWRSLAGGFDARKAKFATGDVDGDGADEVMALYDRGGTIASAFVFDPSGTGDALRLVPERWWDRKPMPCAWRDMMVTAADLSGDGRCDLVMFANDVPRQPSIWILRAAEDRFDAAVICTRTRDWIYERTQLMR